MNDHAENDKDHPEQVSFAMMNGFRICPPIVSNAVTCPITEPLHFCPPIVPSLFEKDSGENALESACGQSRFPANVQHPQKIRIVDPYHVLSSRNANEKRRKNWPHAFEESIFTKYELWTVGTAARRKAYIPSLEAYVDILHARLQQLGVWPVPYGDLEELSGLNSVLAKKAMVSALQRDANNFNAKLMALEHAANELRESVVKFYLDG